MNSNKTKISIWICTARYQGIWVSRLSGFRGCSNFSGKRYMGLLDYVIREHLVQHTNTLSHTHSLSLLLSLALSRFLSLSFFHSISLSPLRHQTLWRVSEFRMSIYTINTHIPASYSLHHSSLHHQEVKKVSNSTHPTHLPTQSRTLHILHTRQCNHALNRASQLWIFGSTYTRSHTLHTYLRTLHMYIYILAPYFSYAHIFSPLCNQAPYRASELRNLNIYIHTFSHPIYIPTHPTYIHVHSRTLHILHMCTRSRHCNIQHYIGRQNSGLQHLYTRILTPHTYSRTLHTFTINHLSVYRASELRITTSIYTYSHTTHISSHPTYLHHQSFSRTLLSYT